VDYGSRFSELEKTAEDPAHVESPKRGLL